jgi:membrane protein
MRKYLTIFKRAFASYGSHKDASFAGGISYNAIFSIFPLILLAVSVLGFFIHDPAQRQKTVDALFSVLGQDVSRDALRSQVDAIAGGSAKLGILALVAAAWSATGVFDQIRTALQVVFDSNKPRPFAQQKLIDFGMLFSVGLLVLLSIASAAVLTALASFGSALLGRALGPGIHLLFLAGSIIVPVVILFCAFSFMYWLVPHAEIRFKNVWLGALTAAVAFQLVQLLFAFYVASFGHYAQTYGALAGIIAFLFFIYLAASIILLGGEVAKEYIDVVTGAKPAVEPKQPGPKQSPLQQAEGAVKGLFIDPSPHHDTSRPYEPGRTEPLQPDANMKTDEQSRTEDEQCRPSDQQSRPQDGGRERTGERPPARTGARSAVVRPLVGAEATLRSWELTVATVVSLLTILGGYELMHRLTGVRIARLEDWKSGSALSVGRPRLVE